MLKHIPAKDSYEANHGWLKTRHLFSFSHYYDPQNTHWGSLRVFNDDWVQPNTGFPQHPHQEMEIVSIIMAGAITHEDSMGNKETIREGQVQQMSAGTGIYHSEQNEEDKPLNLYQLWLFPEAQKLEPSYQTGNYTSEQYHNKLLLLCGGQQDGGVVSMHSSGRIYRAKLEAGQELTHETEPSRYVLVYMHSGKLKTGGKELQEHDQLRANDESQLTFTAQETAEFILVDAPAAP